MAAVEPQLPTNLHGELRGHEGSVMSVRFNSAGTYCLTGGKDRLVKLWNPHTQLCIKTYKGHGFDVNDAVASDDNCKIGSCSSDKQVILWDVAGGQVIRKCRGHTSSVLCVRFNSDATALVSGSYDKTVRIWDLRAQTNDAMQVMDEAKDSVPSLEVRDHEILTGSVDGHVRCYDLRMGRLRMDFIGDPVTCVSFSRDGKCILASSLDNTIRLLDKDSGELLADYSGHKSKDYKVDSCLSHNDAFVVSGSEDGKLCFWELVSGKLLKSIEAHKRVVCSLSYHPREPCVITACVDGTVRVWKNTPGKGSEEDGDEGGEAR